jgi:serine/threonine protein kinase
MVADITVDAILYLHQSGVYHRDLKDENVVIDQNLNVKLIDFGSAVCEDTRLAPKRYAEFKGTDAYAAPGMFYISHSLRRWLTR